MSRPRTTFGLCAAPACEIAAYCKGFCKKHYSRLWRRGNVNAGEFGFEFESRILKTDYCWLWVGALFKSGYGKFSRGDRKIRAHRASYELYVGKIPRGMQVLHRCDNPPCVNPDHLFIGTHMDNMLDMESKGRAKWIQENLRRKHELFIS